MVVMRNTGLLGLGVIWAFIGTRGTSLSIKMGGVDPHLRLLRDGDSAEYPSPFVSNVSKPGGRAGREADREGQGPVATTRRFVGRFIEPCSRIPASSDCRRLSISDSYAGESVVTRPCATCGGGWGWGVSFCHPLLSPARRIRALDSGHRRLIDTTILTHPRRPSANIRRLISGTKIDSSNAAEEGVWSKTPWKCDIVTTTWPSRRILSSKYHGFESTYKRKK